MSVGLEGGCSCGMVRYRLTSEPLFVHCCHCLNCQRQTGSAFVINLLIETGRIELLAGEPQPVDAPRDDGSAQRIFRCPPRQDAGWRRPRAARGLTVDAYCTTKCRPTSSAIGGRFLQTDLLFADVTFVSNAMRRTMSAKPLDMNVMTSKSLLLRLSHHRNGLS